MSDSSGRAIAFLLGATAGGIAALMLAPASGRKTRRRMAKATADLYSQGLDSAERATNKVGELAQEVGTAVRRTVTADDGKHADKRR